MYSLTPKEIQLLITGLKTRDVHNHSVKVGFEKSPKSIVDMCIKESDEIHKLICKLTEGGTTLPTSMKSKPVEEKQQYKLMTKKEYIDQRMQIAKDSIETQWERTSKGDNYILTTVKDGSTHYYSLDYFHATVNPKIAIGAVTCK